MVTNFNIFLRLNETAPAVVAAEKWLKNTWELIQKSGVDYRDLGEMIGDTFGKKQASIFFDDRYRKIGGISSTYGDGSDLDASEFVNGFGAFREYVDGYLKGKGVLEKSSTNQGNLFDELKEIAANVADNSIFEVLYAKKSDKNYYVIVSILGKEYKAFTVPNRGYGSIYIRNYSGVGNAGRFGLLPGSLFDEITLTSHLSELKKEKVK